MNDCNSKECEKFVDQIMFYLEQAEKGDFEFVEAMRQYIDSYLKEKNEKAS